MIWDPFRSRAVCYGIPGDLFNSGGFLMKRILGLVFALAGLFCLNSCKNYIDKLSIAGNVYKMTEAFPFSPDEEDADVVDLVGNGCFIRFNKDGSTYRQTYGSGNSEASSGTYEVNTAGMTVVLNDSRGGSRTYAFSERGAELNGVENWNGNDFYVKYRLQ